MYAYQSFYQFISKKGKYIYMNKLRSLYPKNPSRLVKSDVGMKRTQSWLFAILLLVLGVIMVIGGIKPIGYILLSVGMIIGVYKVTKLKNWYR